MAASVCSDSFQIEIVADLEAQFFQINPGSKVLPSEESTYAHGAVCICEFTYRKGANAGDHGDFRFGTGFSDVNRAYIMQVDTSFEPLEPDHTGAPGELKSGSFAGIVVIPGNERNPIAESFENTITYNNNFTG